MGICKICGEPADYDLANFEGHPVHRDCAVMACSIETALEYAKAYPKSFFEDLKELLTCTDHPELTKAAELILKDFRDTWGGEKPFVNWIADN